MFAGALVASLPLIVLLIGLMVWAFAFLCPGLVP